MLRRLAPVIWLFGATIVRAQQPAPAGAPPDDAPYATPALRALVAGAAALNRAPPSTLRGYRASVETEIGFVLRDTLGRELTTQVEQLASDARWRRGGAYVLHVVGYRSQSVGAPFSALGLVRSWTVPTLYGDRLDIGLEPRKRRGGRGADAGDTIHAVHPLAADRDLYYRFDGGDTITTMRTPYGATPVVRIHVAPRTAHAELRLALFEGELEIDAVRLALVRMRGRILVTGRPLRRRPLLSRLPGLVAAAYVELVNAQLDGAYWLPTYQRTELQANFAPFGESRSILRLVSTFTSHALDVVADSATPARAGSESDSAEFQPPDRRVTFAASDSLSKYRNWRSTLGEATVAVSGADFDDLAPRAWRSSLPRTRVHLYPRKLDDVLRYDRVEGLYTGLSVTAEHRDGAGARSVRAFGGYAWTERTVRGGGAATISHGPTTVALRAERQLANTNDFTGALSGTMGLAGFLGVDDADYVDRRVAALDVTRSLGSVDRGLVQLELGVGSDRPDSARLTRGPILAGDGFRPNRGVAPGRFVRAAAVVELHPGVTGLFLDPGLGMRLRGEIGRGDLNWSRLEATIAGRRVVGEAGLQARVAGGVVLGRVLPPQQLFELGGNEGLAGYGYKAFAGDRAGLARLRATYTAPVLRRPRRVWRDYFVPGLSPGLLLGLDGGWAGAPTASARQALAALGSAKMDGSVVPVSRPTRTVRTTVDVRLTLFGGGVSAGVARPIDHPGPWRAVFALGQEL